MKLWELNATLTCFARTEPQELLLIYWTAGVITQNADFCCWKMYFIQNFWSCFKLFLVLLKNKNLNKSAQKLVPNLGIVDREIKLQ